MNFEQIMDRALFRHEWRKTKYASYAAKSE